MSLTTRVDRLETTIEHQDCSESHYRIHIAHVDIDGTETADPEPEPCPTCGGAPDVQRIVITTVPDRGE